MEVELERNSDELVVEDGSLDNGDEDFISDKTSRRVSALTVKLYTRHFTVGDPEVSFKYEGPFKTVLEAIELGELRPEHADLFQENEFYNGTVTVDVLDYRFWDAEEDASGARKAVALVKYHPTEFEAKKKVYRTFLALESKPVLSIGARSQPSAQPFSVDGSFAMTTRELEFTGNVVKRRVCLRPVDGTLWSNVLELNDANYALGGRWTASNGIAVESALLNCISQPVCLDVDRKVLLLKLKIAASEHPNYMGAVTRESSQRRKRLQQLDKILERRLQLIREPELASKQAQADITTVKPKEFWPRFQQYSFIEAWRRKRELADNEQLCGPEKKKGRRGSVAVAMLGGKKVVRAVRFEAPSDKVQCRYLSLFVVDLGRNVFEIIIRLGSQEGTAIRGQSLRFDVGNDAAVDAFLLQFKQHMLQSMYQEISDTIAVSSARASRAASVNAGTTGVATPNSAIAPYSTDASAGSTGSSAAAMAAAAAAAAAAVSNSSSSVSMRKGEPVNSVVFSPPGSGNALELVQSIRQKTAGDDGAAATNGRGKKSKTNRANPALAVNSDAQFNGKPESSQQNSQVAAAGMSNLSYNSDDAKLQKLQKLTALQVQQQENAKRSMMEQNFAARNQASKLSGKFIVFAALRRPLVKISSHTYCR